MGLIKAALGTLGGALADQWKEFIYCPSMPADVLLTKGQKRVTDRSSNTKGDDNIISAGSVIAVNEGQCMMIVDQGRIVDFSAEPGEYTYTMSSEPSIFCGGLNMDLIKKAFERFGFGGQAGKDQRVYFVNTKEIMGNKYGTPNPIPFRVVDKNANIDIDVGIKIHGEYSYKITNPINFYKNVAGNVSGNFTRDTIDSQLKSELMTALQPALAKISEMQIRYSALPAHTMEISDALNSVLSTKWAEDRGIEVASFGVSSVVASKEDEDMLKQLQRSAAFKDPTMGAAAIVDAQADAMKAAARNQGGAAIGFMGMNMAAGAGGVNASNLYAMGAQQAQQQPQAPAAPAPAPEAPAADTWQCGCGATVSGNFCSNCGAKKPEAPAALFCTNCGTKLPDGAKFCSNCGQKL